MPLRTGGGGETLSVMIAIARFVGFMDTICASGPWLALGVDIGTFRLVTSYITILQYLFTKAIPRKVRGIDGYVVVEIS